MIRIMRKLLNTLVFVSTAISITSCGNPSGSDFKEGKAMTEPEVNEVEVITLESVPVPWCSRTLEPVMKPTP